MRVHEFSAEIWLPVKRNELFPFFASAANLDAITPPWLHFQILTPFVKMSEGALIDYRLRVRGIPMRWRTRINLWEPPLRFVDEQIRGPYRLWVHEHSFEECEGGTLARDNVRYAVPLDSLAHRWVVRPDIERIFRFRQEAMRERFGSVGEAGS